VLQVDGKGTEVKNYEQTSASPILIIGWQKGFPVKTQHASHTQEPEKFLSLSLSCSLFLLKG
jgi:hypothetical protein